MNKKSISTRTSTSGTISSNPTRSKSYRARTGCLLAGFILFVALIIGFFPRLLHLESAPDPAGPPDLTGAGSTVQDNTLWGEDDEGHQRSVDFNEFPLPGEAVLGDPPPLPPLPLHRLYYHPQTGNFWYIDDEGISQLVQFNMTVTLRGERIGE